MLAKFDGTTVGISSNGWLLRRKACSNEDHYFEELDALAPGFSTARRADETRYPRALLRNTILAAKRSVLNVHSSCTRCKSIHITSEHGITRQVHFESYMRFLRQ